MEAVDKRNTDTDIGFVHSVLWSDMLRNLGDDAAHPEAAGPGHWNDPDYLGPELGMTGAEAQAQFTMWSIVAAPLIIGSDIRSMSATTQAMLTNSDVIAVDQDSLGVQGTRIAQEGNGDVWVKPLANGDRAVALLNRGTSPLTITTSTAALGLAHADSYTLNDLWSHQSTETAGQISATAAHVDDAGDGNYNDRADWAGLQLTCGAAVATVPHGPWPHFVLQSSLTATATSAHPGYPASAAVDGKLTTIWHSEFSPPAPLPQSITLDLGSVHSVAGLTYHPRLDTYSTGTITDYTVYVSIDGTTFTSKIA